MAERDCAVVRHFPANAFRSFVLGHVLLRGHARNSAADHVESQVVQLFEADATLTHVELLAALRLE